MQRAGLSEEGGFNAALLAGDDSSSLFPPLPPRKPQIKEKRVCVLGEGNNATFFANGFSAPPGVDRKG